MSFSVKRLAQGMSYFVFTESSNQFSLLDGEEVVVCFKDNQPTRRFQPATRINRQTIKVRISAAYILSSGDVTTENFDVSLRSVFADYTRRPERPSKERKLNGGCRGFSWLRTMRAAHLVRLTISRLMSPRT